MTDIYIVFHHVKDESPEFMGAFSTRQGAEAICSDWTYVVCPAPIDVAFSVERTQWPGAYYPVNRTYADVELPSR